MQHTNQYFFSVDKLSALIEEYGETTVGGNKSLKGFVFTPGYEPDNEEPVVFAFPVFSSNSKAGNDGDILIQNTKVTLSGCPYPPPCESKRLTGDCYSD